MDVSAGSGVCPTGFPARSVAVLDFDGDGLLDLLVGECVYQGGDGRSKLFRNLGNFKFEDVTAKVGLPARVPGLGVAACDVNNDGFPDIILTGRASYHKEGTTAGARLFLNDGKGHFKEMPGSRELFAYKGAGDQGGDNMVCGVCFCDVNRDGLLDIVLGQHYATPWRESVPNKLFINRGVKDGVPMFEEVTEKAGLTPLGLKSPHVEFQDFDNDGWPDIYFSTVKFKDGKPYPVIFRHQGVVKDGVPQFRDDAWAVNDFPTAVDRAIQGSGKMFEKVIKEKKVIYMAPGPVGDYDNDGRKDLFAALGAILDNSWEVERLPAKIPNLLLRNNGSVFRDESANAGASFAEPRQHRGAAFGDLNNDGRIDVLLLRGGCLVSCTLEFLLHLLKLLSTCLELGFQVMLGLLRIFYFLFKLFDFEGLRDC